MLKCVMLTPGTGNFFCGSCLRDHSLARGLKQEGVDITMVPLYLPHVAEDNLSTSPLFFGGINLYVQRKFPWFEKSPTWLRNLLDHPALLRFVSRFSGMTSAQDLGEMTLSSLEMKGSQVEFVKLVDWLGASVQPDIVILSNCLLVGFAAELKRRLKCKVASTLQGEDSFLDSLPEPFRTRAWEVLQEKCRDVDLFMPVSRTYGYGMQQRLNLPFENVQVVYNGIDLEGIPEGTSTPPMPALGFLANIIPGKGLSTLAKAFVHLKRKREHASLRLIILGSVTPFTKGYLNEVTQYLENSGVLKDCEIKTNLSRDEKYEALKKVSILSVPATYGESFGLYILEALAMGIPVVQPDHGAFRELLDTLKGGLLCEPDHAEDLALQCEVLLNDEGLRRRLGAQGKKNVKLHFTQLAMAKRVATLLKELHD